MDETWQHCHVTLYLLNRSPKQMTRFTEPHAGVSGYLVLGDAQLSLQAPQGCPPHSHSILLLQLIRHIQRVARTGICKMSWGRVQHAALVRAFSYWIGVISFLAICGIERMFTSDLSILLYANIRM